VVSWNTPDASDQDMSSADPRYFPFVSKAGSLLFLSLVLKELLGDSTTHGQEAI
jgi:hypothetical protein